VPKKLGFNSSGGANFVKLEASKSQ
jgi:hypothetical protein